MYNVRKYLFSHTLFVRKSIYLHNYEEKNSMSFFSFLKIGFKRFHLYDVFSGEYFYMNYVEKKTREKKLKRRY